MQEAAPADDETKPAGHAKNSHLVKSDDEVNPGSEQGVQEAAPADGATKPAAHGAHADWPALPEKEPALQGLGWAEPRGQ